jgi:nitrogenase molybdenum-iron protein beta chain
MNIQSRLDEDARSGFAASPGPIEQVRYACALGALASVIAIEGAIPITH